MRCRLYHEYRVRQNKISKRENGDIYIMQEYFTQIIPHLFSTYVFTSFFLFLFGVTHASAEACLRGWPNAQPQGSD